jgi:hypothetical protein
MVKIKISIRVAWLDHDKSSVWRVVFNQCFADLEIAGHAQSLDCVLQFSDITRPGIVFQDGHGSLGYGNPFGQYGAVMSNEVPHEIRDILNLIWYYWEGILPSPTVLIFS